MKTKRNKLRYDHYWAAIDHRGKQPAGDTVRRNVERAVKNYEGTRIVQLPKE